MTTYQVKVRDAIINDPTVSKIVGGRIYAIRSPQKPVYPLTTITTISHELQPHLRGVAPLEKVRVRVDMYGERYTDLQALDGAIRSALHAATGFSATYVFGFEMFEDDTQLYHLVSEYSVWHG